AEMTEAGLLRQSSGEYPVLEITNLGRQVLQGRATAEVTLPQVQPPPPRRRDSAPEPASVDGGRLEKLRRWRLEVSRRDGVPAFVVFHDRTLAALAAASPRTAGELAQVPGVGPAKLERYGADLLELFNQP
ncbi:MAG: HRDC domain-containing protein, partial [Candidatus Dormibacteraeota bacterium]|nr:HRDC domain-containing protein [Candidatus Dormibacteraeota bacterium]